MTKRSRVLAAVLGLVLVAVGCGDDGDGGDGEAAPDADLEVRTVEETYVDEARETPRSGDVPAVPSRTLESLVFLPEGDGPYPLLVYSHGLASSPEDYLPLHRRGGQRRLRDRGAVVPAHE